MNEDPVKNLIVELGAHLSQKEHSDVCSLFRRSLWYCNRCV